MDVSVRSRLKTIKRLQNKKWIIKGNFEEGINENYIVISHIKLLKIFSHSLIILYHTLWVNVNSLYNLFYKLLYVISITYLEIEIEIKGK